MKLAYCCMLTLLSLGHKQNSAPTCYSLLPKQARTVIDSEKRRGWALVSIKDLPDDDQRLWRQEHSGKCPAIAEGTFVSGTAASYAFALLRRNQDGRYSEKLIALLWSQGTYSRKVIVPPTNVVSPFVVWTVPPGAYRGIDSKILVAIPTDSFVYEKMEATATQFYFRNGKLYSLTTAD